MGCGGEGEVCADFVEDCSVVDKLASYVGSGAYLGPGMIDDT